MIFPDKRITSLITAKPFDLYVSSSLYFAKVSPWTSKQQVNQGPIRFIRIFWNFSLRTHVQTDISLGTLETSLDFLPDTSLDISLEEHLVLVARMEIGRRRSSHVTVAHRRLTGRVVVRVVLLVVLHARVETLIERVLALEQTVHLLELRSDSRQTLGSVVLF